MIPRTVASAVQGARIANHVALRALKDGDIEKADGWFRLREREAEQARELKAKNKYFVLNEHTLCYSQEGSSLLGVLAGKPQLGGHDWLNGPINVSVSDTLRAATLQDFEYFRVSSTGHIS